MGSLVSVVRGVLAGAVVGVRVFSKRIVFLVAFCIGAGARDCPPLSVFAPTARPVVRTYGGPTAAEGYISGRSLRM